MQRFVEVTKEQMEAMTVEMCVLCCHCGTIYKCGAAKCLPHQREDGKRGYFVDDTENGTKEGTKV